MAVSNVVSTLPGVVAGADLSGAQFLAVTLNSSGEAVLPTALGDEIVGVLQNKPTAGQAASIWGVGSLTKMVATAAIAAGASVTVEAATGKAITASVVGQLIIGKTLNAAAADGELISVYITQPGAF